jgi:3-hydroxyisobutyrate dehydrogenase-like beta-hydroxyacid dehydrogenase
MLTPSATIACIGFGQVGARLGGALARRGSAVRAYDLRLNDPITRASMTERIDTAGVDPVFTLRDCLRGAKLVISAVPPAHTDEVAAAAAALLQPGQLFLDANVLEPERRRANAARVRSAGAEYVEIDVLKPLLPNLDAQAPALTEIRAPAPHRGELP